MDIKIFDQLESEVRSYCRSFPVVFSKARGAVIEDERGREYLDFLAGAGTLNYGHNPPALKAKLIEYLQSDGLVHGLDLHSVAKRRFLEVFDRHILWPLESHYKVQFTGPTGTNAVEAALKLARNVTGRTNVVSFTNGFHGVSLGSVAATGNDHFRSAAGVPLGNVSFMPYDNYLGPDVESLDYMRKFLEDSSSGVDLPAAVIVETVQGEGGVNVASWDWLRGLEALCREYDILLIVDDIQIGCGRAGTFFSFEEAGISPDMVTLSKSLSGYGLPMSLLLMKQELDRWKPGEHNGTFRGHNLAFVTAAEAIRLFWTDTAFTRQVKEKGRLMKKRLEAIADRYPSLELEVRGRGMIWGVVSERCPELAGAVSQAAFRRKLIIETSGSTGQVLKLLPPLTIETSQLEQGLDAIEEGFDEVLSDDTFVKEHDLAMAE